MATLFLSGFQILVPVMHLVHGFINDFRIDILLESISVFSDWCQCAFGAV